MTKYTLLLVFLFIALANSQSCFRCKPNKCNQKNQCDQCEDGFMLTSQSWCGLFTPIDKCRKYDVLNTSRCFQCFSDRQLIDGRCFTRPQNCRSADLFKYCLMCEQGFQLFQGSCYSKNITSCPQGSLPYLGFCRPFAQKNKNGCTNLQRLLNGVCLQITNVTNCFDSTCECLEGLKYNNSCFKIRLNKCTLYRDPLFCEACEEGFIAIDGACFQPIKVDDPNCNTKTLDYCSGCNKGYQLNVDFFCQKNYNMLCPVSSNYFYKQKDACFFLDRRCEAVKLIGNQTYVCLRCPSGFSLINNVCQRNICVEFNDNKCQRAFLGYKIVGINQYIRLPTNCLQIDEAQNCTKCSQFTKLTLMDLKQPLSSENKYVCAYQDQNCQQYNSNGSCIKCMNQNKQGGYTLKNRGCSKVAQNCQERNNKDLSQCFKCITGYHLDQASFLCYVDEPGCERYSSKSECKQCNTSLNFILYKKNCYLLDPQCIDYDENYFCRRCLNGYLPFKNACVYYHPFCLQYGTDRVCSKAAAGWTLGTGMTQAQKSYFRRFVIRGSQVRSRSENIPGNSMPKDLGQGAGQYLQGAIISRIPFSNLNHARINSVNMFGQITSCKSPFILNSNLCLSRSQNIKQFKVTIQNCLKINDANRCLDCKQPYKNVDGQCIIEIENCLDYGFSKGHTPGICQQCLGNRTYWFGQCRSLTCNSINNKLCVSCPANFTYGFGFCQPNTLPNCKFFQNNICGACLPGYYVTAQNQCQQQIKDCLNTNKDTGRCIQCRYGFTLYRQKCVKQTRSCMDYDQNAKCTRCQQNQVNLVQLMQDKTCIMLEGQCNAISQKTKKCASCQLGYTLIEQDSKLICVMQRKNCQTYDVRGRCIQCLRPYALIRNQCQLFIPFCLNYTSDNTKCTLCFKGSDLEKGCCRLPDRACSSYNYNQCICQRCNLTYFLNILGVCEKNPIGCDIFNLTANQCTKCTEGYYLISDGKCKASQQMQNGCQNISKIIKGESVQFECLNCISIFEKRATNTLCFGFNCKTWDSSYRFCTECPTYYKIFRNKTLDEKLAFCIPYFCETYIPGSDQCQKNITIYKGGHKISDRTVSILSCTNQQSNGKCASCMNYRYPSNKTLFNLCYPLHCKNEDEYNCQQCQFGYGLHPNITGTCVAVNCKVYRIDGSCEVCNQPFTLSSTYICENKGCCDIYDQAKNICSRPKKYFTIQNSVCAPNNCLKKDLTKMTSCLVCIFGYTLFPDGTCRINNCEVESTLGDTCITCKKGYKPEASPKNPGKFICAFRYCKVWSDDYNFCLQCPQGFILNKDKMCQASFCDVFQNSGVCKSCAKYYIIGEDQRCVANCSVGTSDKCQCCKLGSSLNATSGLCQPSQSFCSTFNQRTGSCTKCIDNYSVVSGKCVLPPLNCRIPSLLGCESCTLGYQLRNNCQCVPKYCKIWDSNGKCTTCHPRFQRTSEGLCKTRDCQFFSIQLWACNGCYNGFRYVDNTCVSNNCKIWQDPQNTTCKQCQTSLIIEPSLSRQPLFTYQLVQGACYIRYCQRDPRQLFCKSCYPGYKLVSNGLCACQNYDFIKKLCICPSGYLYNQQTTLCSLDRNPCLLRTDKNICIQCPVTYEQPTNNNGSCIPLYCNKWKQNSPGQFVCQQCAPNFKVVNGFCQSIFCRRLENVTGFALPQCRQCVAGYFTFSSFCVPLHCDRLTYDIKNGLCKKCVDLGYQLSQNQTRCIVSNCQIQLFPDKCRKCKFGYQIFSGEICIARNCTIYNQTKCKECISGFYLKDQVCFASNCQVYGEENVCIKCSDGFIISDNFTCIRRNCQIDSLPRCVQCYLGYYVNPSMQSCVPVNCKKYQENFTKCQTCNDGFFKQNGTCVDIRCEVNGFDREYNCKKCQQGFQPNKNKLCYPKDISICPQGKYYSNQAKGCVNITQLGCLFFNPSTNACIWCAENYFLYNNLCYSVRYCTSFSYYFGCYQCIQGYYIQNRVCIQQILDPNCNKANGKRCIICNDGFTLISNKCIRNPKNCISVNSDGNCQKCDDGYLLKGINCVQIDENCLQFVSNKCRRCRSDFYINRIGLCSRNPQNCIQSNINGLCIRCSLGFQFVNMVCVRKVVACLRYDQSSQNCIQCFDNFTLSSNECICSRGNQLITQQLCIKLPDNCASISPANFLCSQCLSPFLLRSDFKCAVPQAPQNCQTYDPQTGQCKKCFSNFILLSNLCVKCPNNQIQVQNKCFNKRIGCQDYGLNGQCKKCIIGFQLKGEICQSQVQIPQFCIRHLYEGSNVKCLECDSKYNLSPDGKSCILKNCIQMDLSRRVCVRCASPFQWNGQMCIFTTDFCLFYSNGYCSNCSDWSRLDKNRCVPNNCSNYNYQLGACQSCSAGFNLNLVNKRCFMIIPFCIEYQNTGLCVRCTTLYSVSNNGLSCSAGAVPNCYFQSGTSCGRCRHRFYVDSNACSAYIPYCTNIDPQGKCISCCFGSTLRNGICVKDDTIKYCLSQVGNKCQKCMQNYYYCNFCDACLPASPNCNKYNNLGQCVQCVGQFSLANGVCISLPVGIMSGTTATCRFGYYMKDSNCYRNPSDLQLFSSKGSVTISSSGDYFSIIKQGDALIIFSIIINIRTAVSNDASFFLYYKSKNSDPFICWNSCIPTKIDSRTYTKDLVHPIIAKQVRVYLTNQNVRSADLDLKILD